MAYGKSVNLFLVNARTDSLVVPCMDVPQARQRLRKGIIFPVPYVIHTVGPIWYGGDDGEPDLLAPCYYNSLKVAVENGIDKVAFPSISTGVYGHPVDKAAKVAVHTVENFMKDNPGRIAHVYWVCFDDRTLEAYENEINKLY